MCIEANSTSIYGDVTRTAASDPPGAVPFWYGLSLSGIGYCMICIVVLSIRLPSDCAAVIIVSSISSRQTSDEDLYSMIFSLEKEAASGSS